MLKKIIWSWDIGLAFIIALLIYYVAPENVSVQFAQDAYSIGVSVLSIIFSVFFAALAIIMSATDNEFIRFLEKDNSFTRIINTFRVSLLILFLALLYSLLLYCWTSYSIVNCNKLQSKWFIVIFAFLFSYGLFASVQSISDAITYSKYRTRFLMSKKKDM